MQLLKSTMLREACEREAHASRHERAALAARVVCPACCCWSALARRSLGAGEGRSAAAASASAWPSLVRSWRGSGAVGSPQRRSRLHHQHAAASAAGRRCDRLRRSGSAAGMTRFDGTMRDAAVAGGTRAHRSADPNLRSPPAAQPLPMISLQASQRPLPHLMFSGLRTPRPTNTPAAAPGASAAKARNGRRQRGGGARPRPTLWR